MMLDGLTVGQVAQAAGITPDTVRYYERLRLLPPPRRTSAGYRVFDRAEVDRVRVIKRAQALGLSLAEIKALFPLSTLARTECRGVRRLLAEKIAQTDARMLELQRFKSELAAYLRVCDRAIARGADAPCPIFANDRVSVARRAKGSGRR
jgi:DNA-binding transcriptional MerR regulator